VRGIADILTTDGMVVDVKTASRKPSALAADHALQLATYTQLVRGASAMALQAKRESTRWLGRRIHCWCRSSTRRARPGGAWRDESTPVAEGIAGGLYLPNRSSTVCSTAYCAFAEACEPEFGGTRAA
jgi:hypothetical protein